MALIQCPECGKDISDKASVCPHCGCPITTEISSANNSSADTGAHKKHHFVVPIILLAVLALVIVSIVIHRLSEYDPPSNVAERLVDDAFSREIHTLEEVDASVVTVYCYDMFGKEYGEELGTGSGFIAFDDQTVITNFHVYESGEDIRVVTEDGTEYLVDSAIALSYKKDIAVLHLAKPTGLKPLEFGDPDVIDKGEPVTAIGSPLGMANTVSEGIISRKYAEPEMGGITILQTTAPISPGSSGGALFDKTYRVVGVTFAGYDEGQNLNLAIPINVVTEIYESKNTDDEKIREENLYDIAIYTSLTEGCNADCFFDYPSLQDEMFEVAKETPTFVEHMARISDGKENPHIIRSNQDVIVRHRILSNTEYAVAKVMFKYITYVDDRGEMVASWDIDYPEVLIIMCTMGGFDWNYYDNEQKEAICDYFYADKNKTIRDRAELKAILEWIGYDVVFENDGSITAYW